jgi:hypothetical protein
VSAEDLSEGTQMPTRWQVNENYIRSPSNKVVAVIVEDLSSIERDEFIKRVIYAPGRAYRQGFEDAKRDSDGILSEPEDL